MRPGMIWLTRIFEDASSIASVFARADTDARSTVDNPRFGTGSFTDDEVDTRIAPPPRDFMCGTAARTIRMVLNNKRSAASCHARSSNEIASPAGGPPELVMMPSIPQNRSAAAAIHFSIASDDRTSTGIANTFEPVSRSIRSDADVMDAGSRDEIETVAPSAPSAWATAYPRPLLAPAINMTLFLS